jgi:hypothetical protein
VGEIRIGSDNSNEGTFDSRSNALKFIYMITGGYFSCVTRSVEY